jgi:hypothetical protein
MSEFVIINTALDNSYAYISIRNKIRLLEQGKIGPVCDNREYEINLLILEKNLDGIKQQMEGIQRK